MKKFFLSLIPIFFLVFCMMPHSAPAQASESKFIEGLKTTAGQTAGAGYITDKSPDQIFAKMAGSIFNPVWVGTAGLLILIYGGYKWMMSRGNEQEVELAKAILKNTIIALAVIFAAWAIVRLIIPIWELVSKK